MRNKIILLLAIISVCLSTDAQIMIDFDRDLNYTPTAEGYTQWITSDVTSSSGSTSTEINGITITLSWGDNTSAAELTRNYWKDGMTKPYDKLVSDGIYFKDITSNSVAIDVEITGLPKGTHSIQAYHNNVDGNVGKILPPINVAVNDVDVLTDVEQTCRVQDRSESAKTYITFTVSSDTKATKITYYTNPKSGVDYASKAFYINALEIGDIVNANNQAQNPSPANLDYHVDADSGVELSWTAAEGATSHIVYFGENEESVENGTCEVINTTSNSITKSGLSPLKRYYWRVDEVKNGVTTKGDVWSFQPRRDAFPGAEGYGRYAIGGRGWKGNGKVYHVTSLDDDATNPQPGTFRYGIVNATEPTTIVFDVSGVIHLTDRLTNSNPYVTIAGQTAPGNGIMFRGAPLGVASEGITRYVRLRRGDIDDDDGNTITITVDGVEKTVPADCGKGLDGMGMAGNNHSIMDHCSIGWTVDEAFSSRNAKNITLQHTLISEALNIAGHPNYDAGTGHGYAATVGGDKGSLHHNLLAHNAGRNWSMGGGLDGAGYYKDYLDMFNNVCYNWVDRTTDGGVHVGKFVNNYYKMGPASKKMQLIMAHLEKVGEGTQQYYVKGNIRENYGGSIISQSATLSPKGESGDEAIYTMRNDKGSSYTADAFFDSEDWEHYFDSWATIETAKAAFKNVLSDVGCNYAGLDNHDVRMVSETLNGTTSTTGSKGNLAGIIDATTDTGCEGFAGLNIKTAERPDNWDEDGDGIPAWFETAMGWSDSVGNNNDDRDSDYYTDLEEYLNWMAVPHFYNMANDGTVTALKTGTNHTITLADYFAGYTSPSYIVVSNGGATASISNGVLTYNFPANSSKLATIQVKATQDGISLTRSFNFFIDGSNIDEPETPVVTPEGDEYMISSETSQNDKGAASPWTFENGFTITNTSSKTYNSASYSTIKYSRNVEYTINIPDGMSVNAIKFYGYTNVDNTNDGYADGYLASLNETSYSNSTYTFPSRSTSTTKEHTITFSESVTGKITFKMASNECALAITLYATGTPAVTPDDDTELAPAFPGAEGSGRYAQGGRGTDGFTNVYHVTSLADDGSEGTLRWALAQDGPRTIVFDVSGYIDLTDDLQIPSYTTIAGQTAPEPGITLRYYTVNTNNSKNVIIRYMRFRRSQVKDVDDGADAAYGKNGKNIILDHCSFSWSIDEVASFYDNRDFTMQWCVVAEGLNSGHEKGTHSYGGIWGGKNATFHHNMITNVHNRAPRLCGARYNWGGYDTEAYANSVQAERVDVRNNLYYNWGQGNGAYGGMGGYHNLVNNYYKAGPGTKNTSRVFQGSVNDSKDSNGALPDGLPGRFYIYGNYVKAEDEILDWSGFIQDEGTGVNTTALTYTDSQGLYGTAGATVNIKLDKEVDMADVTTHTAANAYSQILLYGGASLYRDAVDERLMSDTENETATYPTTSDANSTPGIVDEISDPAAVAVEGQPSFPMLAVVERPANWDTDRDGIPDAWEDANGLDKNNAADGNLYTLDSEKTWYTNLEVYLNSIVEDITMAQKANAQIEIEDEYYPEWKEPTAESLTEFVLSDKTHSYGSANVWTFSNGFGVTGDADRKYASAGDYIKYSGNYEYTISVPSNVTVYKVKVEGYANAEVGTTSYLAAFGAQTFDETRYVFPSGNASVNRASYEFSLPEAVTGGTLKIQAKGAQTCMIVTLYGEEKSYDLDEVRNGSSTENATVKGTITWDFKGKNTSEFATCGEASENIANYMSTISLAAGSGFASEFATDANWATKIIQKIDGTGTNLDITNPYPVEYNGKKVYQALVRPKSQVNSADEDHKLTFTFNTVNGCTFQPTNVNLKMSKYITSGGDALVKLNDTNVETIETVNSATCQPIDGNISNGADGQYSQVNKNVSASASVDNSLYVYFYKLSKDKCAGIGDVVITGTLTYPKTTVTLDEMATVHNIPSADNATVEMKRGLTAGAWNTFCVPFSISKDKLQEALGGSEVEIVEYTSQEGTTLYFTNTDKIVAGTPYLIKPESFSSKYSADMTPITFKGVNLVAANVNSNNREEVASEVCPGVADYSFVGTYVRYIMKTDGTELGLNSKNKLAKPAASTNIMRGLRGFFRYNAGNGAGAKVVINGTLTSIDEIDGGTAGAKGVYHVSGRYVRSEWNNGSGLPRGLYIVNGQKMVK